MMVNKLRNIGLEVIAPTNICDDKHCVFHGQLVVRGRQFIVNVKKTTTQKTATVELQRLFFISKYQRYEKRNTRLHVHNPKCIDAKIGDKVLVIECRKISKTKNFVIVQRLEK